MGAGTRWARPFKLLAPDPKPRRQIVEVSPGVCRRLMEQLGPNGDGAFGVICATMPSKK